MNNFKNLEEKQISSTNVYDGSFLYVKCDKVMLPNGKTKNREYIKHPGAVCIVAITDDNQLIVEKQFRYPFHDIILEIPAGKLNSDDEEPLEAAKRELREETGFEADSWQPLGCFYPTVAYTDECITMFLARNLHKGEQDLDDDEFLNIDLISFEKFVDMILDGQIKDGKTQAAVLKAAMLLN